MGELGALFNPGMRHEIEERESKANRREEEGNARDGDLRIDLASGVAVINIPGKPNADSATGDVAVAGGDPENSAEADVESTVDRRVPNPAPSSSRSADPETSRRSSSAASARAARANSARAKSATKSGTANRSNDSAATPAAAAPRPASKASRAAR